MIIGDTTLPRINPNLNHKILNGFRIFEFFIPSIKKMNEINKKKKLIKIFLKKNIKLKIKNTKKKVIPKFLFVGIFILSI